MPTTFTSLRTSTALVVGTTLTVVGGFVGAAITGTTITATQLNATTASASTLDVTGPTYGSGKITIGGSSGSYLCLLDSDHDGYSMLRTLNGTITTTIAGSTMCP